MGQDFAKLFALTGPQGPTGSVGPTGAHGVTGATGPVGPTGMAAPSNVAAATVPNWYVDSVNGSDSNDGTGPATPLRTVERLSQILSPNGQIIRLQQATNVFLAAGTYGQFAANVDWFSGAIAFTDQFSVIGSVSSSAPITLSAVVAQDFSTRTSAEITTLSGTFVAGKRIRVVSGPATGAIAFSTGLHANAQNTYVSGWLRYVDGSRTGPGVGDQVVIDTITSTLSQYVVNNYGTSNPVLQDCSVPSGGVIVGNDYTSIGGSTTGGALYVYGCDLTSCYLLSNSGANIWSSRITTSTRIKEGNWKIDGSSIRGILYSYPNANISLDDFGNVFDSGRLVVGGTSSSNNLGPSSCRIAGATEFCNGVSGPAILVSQGSDVQQGLPLWSRSSPGTSYDVGIQVDPDSAFLSSIGFLANTLACVNAYNVCGALHQSFSDAPIIYSQYGASVQVAGSVNPPANASKYLQPPAGSGNDGPHDLFSSPPRKGSYLVDVNVVVAVADPAASGVVIVSVTFRDDSNVSRTIAVVTTPSITGTSWTSNVMSIITNGLQPITYSISGIISPGSFQYFARLNCRLSSDG